MKVYGLVAGCALFVAGLCGAAEQPAAGAPPERPAFRMPAGGGILEGEMPMMPEKLMVRELGLTQEQQKQVREVLSANAGDMQALRSKMEAAAKVQAELISQDAPDEAAVLKGVDDISKLRAEIAKLRIRQVLALHKVLTPEQRAKMREKMKERMDRHMQGDRQHKREGKKPELRGKPEVPPEKQ